MAKSMKCSDVGVACDFEARAETEAELMKKLQEHARTAHGFKDIPPDWWRRSRPPSKTCSSFSSGESTALGDGER